MQLYTEIKLLRLVEGSNGHETRGSSLPSVSTSLGVCWAEVCHIGAETQNVVIC